MSHFDCTVIGDIFLDIAVKADSDPRSFFKGGTSYCNLIKPTFGGSGNVAVGVSTLGGKAAFIGKAGSDLFGKLYVEDLKNNGVFSRVFFDRRSPTGLIVVFVEEKERSFLIFRGANDRLSANEIGKASELIKKSSFVYFCGYSLVHSIQENAVLKAIRLAKEYGVKVVFDPGAYNLVRTKKRLFVKLLDLCDVFSPNLDEALAITDTTDTEGIIRELRDRVPLTALKCGKKGSVMISKKEVAMIRSHGVKCMDTTGAGDAFTAALIYGLTNRLPLQSIGELANWFAAEVSINIGPRSFPSKPRIDHFLEKLCIGSTSNGSSTS